MLQKLHAHWPGILILLIALFIGFDTYQDFGISIDEESQREIGFAAYNYAIGEFDGFTEYQFRDHGPGMEWIYIFFERQLNLSSFRDIFLMRHLVTYLFFVLCGFALYVWIYRVFRNRWLAAFGLAALLFHPVLFGHAFFNPKDIPAMSMFLVCMAATQWAFARQKLWPFFILGLACGYSTTIRLMNIIVLAPVALFFLIDLTKAMRQRGGVARIILAGILVIAGTCITLYACWPALWEDPIAGLQYAYNTSSQYPWKGQMQFAGSYIESTRLPWSYIPTWMFITTPELFVLAGIIGMAVLVARLISEPGTFYANTPHRSILLAFICFFLPLVLIIRLDAVLYDGWRHMYFIYPAFVMLMIYGLNELLQRRQKIIIWSLCCLQLVLTGRFIMKNHPFGHVYFNSFVPHDEDYLLTHYELDYWGTGHKHGLEWLANYDERYGIKILNDYWTLKSNHMFLNEHMHAKFNRTEHEQEADYYLDFFRTYPYRFPNKDWPDTKIIYEKRVLGSPVYRIVKLR